MNHHFLFNRVNDYYADLVSQLVRANQTISMTFLAFDHGEWSQRISQLLRDRSAAGVKVRLMVDGFGEFSDQLGNAFHNVQFLHELRNAGVQVDLFHPSRQGCSPLNRMHCKFVALDDTTVYLGGSNIGDYYTTWTDTNLRVDGKVGNTFHDLYDYLRGFSFCGSRDQPHIDPTGLWAGGDQVRLSIPGHCLSIRSALLDLIRQAKHALYLRTWYFLPDAEILDALCSQASKGVQVNVLLSDKTRVRPIDFANHLHITKLLHSGGHVYRYARRYMHAKVSWNDQGDILFGSANLDPHSLTKNFESCLSIHDHRLAWKLKQVFEMDVMDSVRQSVARITNRSMTQKILSQACNLAAPWL